MKRLLAMLITLCLLLCACGNKPEETTPTTEPTETTTEPTTAPTTEPTEPPVVYRNPLNGEPLDAPYTGRAVSIVMGNTQSALPQHGIGDADILFEVETEGGITRFLSVFSDVSSVGVVGPVRSARTFFNNLSLSLDGVIVHCGGSVRGRNGYSDIDGGAISNWEHLDQAYNGSYFYRDQARRSRGVALEHTLFSTGEDLAKAMQSKGYNTEAERNFGLQFDEEAQLNGSVAEKVVVSFRNDKTTTFTYNKETGLYSTEQYGIAHVDGNTGEQTTFKNVLVIYSPQSFRRDTAYSRSYYELEGEGEGYAAINGQIAKIKWSRESLRTPFVFTLEDGTPLTLGVGHSYIAVACTSSTPVEYE